MQPNKIIPTNQPNTTPNDIFVGESNKKSSGFKSVISTLLIFIAAPVIAVLLTAFVFQSYEVDGPSMQNTLQNRDRLIVWKFSKTISKLTNNDYIPKRDDVIIFVKKDMFEDGTGSEKQLIKRVIGLPGERVVVADDRITVYNKEHPDGFNPDLNHKYSGFIVKPTPGNIDLVLKEGQVFVSGDNRTNSLDSRFFGPVSADDIVGKMVLRIYPFNSFESF